MKWSSEETSASQRMTMELPAQNHLEFLDLNLNLSDEPQILYTKGES